jgi:hypothetical protein
VEVKSCGLDAIRFKSGTGSIIRTLRDHPILAFIALALIARLAFWF